VQESWHWSVISRAISIVLCTNGAPVVLTSADRHGFPAPDLTNLLKLLNSWSIIEVATKWSNRLQVSGVKHLRPYRSDFPQTYPQVMWMK
jgi:hypothetical protein